MIKIDSAIISFDLFDKPFCCDLAVCKGACCVLGDSGAPLEAGEIALLEELYPQFQRYMTEPGRAAVESQGVSVTDREGEKVTPLVHGKECAYAYFENGVALCAIEKAFLAGEIAFQKPISCHLYPVRIAKYKGYDAVNYHKWEICEGAVTCGRMKGVPVYQFLREPLIRKYGERWYNELCTAAAELLENGMVGRV